MRKIFSLLFVTVMSVNLITVSAQSGGANIFGGINAAEYTKIVSGSAVTESDGGIFTTGATVIEYDSVMFDRTATHMDITYSTQEFFNERNIELRLDSEDGEVIAAVALRETTRYNNVVTDTIEVNCNAAGEHDVYLVDVNGSAGRIYSFKLYGMWSDNVLTEKTDTEFSNRQKLLYSLGIIGSVKSEEDSDVFISRKEYAAAVCKTFGLYPVSGNPYGFADDDGYIGYLNVLVQRGYLKGVGGFIRPNDKIALADAAECYIRMSGYGVFLDTVNVGETRNGVLTVAGKYGFTDKIKNTSNKYTSYRDIVNMTVNTLMLKAPKITYGITSNSVSFDSKMTILEDLFDTKKGTGTVNANENTSLGTELEYENEGRVKIDNETYIVGNSGADKYLGMRVRYYYRTDEDDDKEILFIYDTDKLNEVLEIDSEDIESYSDNTLKFNKNNKLKSETIPQTADFTYNEVCCPVYTDEDFIINEGSVTFIDNNRDGKWEVVKVKSAEVYIVDSVDVENGIIYPMSGTDFKNTTLSKIDLSGNDAENVTISLDGIKSDLQPIKEGYTVSVYDSKKNGKNVMRRIAEISSQVITAKIISVNRNNEYRLDNGKVYKRSVSCAQEPENGATYDVHISVYGTIAWFETKPTSRTYRYGFILKGKYDADEEDALKLKILDEDGSVSTIPVYEKATVDGIKADSGEKARELLLNGDESIAPQLVRYKLNADKKISMIDTAYVSPKEDKEHTMKKVLRHAEADYRNTMDYFWQVAPISDDTIVFAMPFEYAQLEKGIDDYADSDYSVTGNARQFTGLNSYTEGFDGTAVKPMGAVVKYKNPTNTVAESNPMIYITEVNETIANDDEIVTQVYGVYNGEMTTLTLTAYATEDYGRFLKEGDLWFFQKDAKGKVSWMVPVWTQNELEGYQRTYDIKKLPVNVGNLYVSYTDNIMDKYKNNISADINGKECGFSLNNTNISLYDKKTKKLKTVTVNQIAKNSQTDRKQYAFIYSYAKQTKYLLIINE